MRVVLDPYPEYAYDPLAAVDPAILIAIAAVAPLWVGFIFGVLELLGMGVVRFQRR